MTQDQFESRIEEYKRGSVIRSGKFMPCDPAPVGRRTYIQSATFSDVIFKDLDFPIHHLDMSECVFENCVFDDILFWSCDLSNTEFVDCKFINVDFDNCNLQYASFVACEYTGMDFGSSNLSMAVFSQSDMTDTRMDTVPMFYDTTVADSTFRGILLQLAKCKTTDKLCRDIQVMVRDAMVEKGMMK